MDDIKMTQGALIELMNSVMYANQGKLNLYPADIFLNSDTAITAKAGGTQALATQITKTFNNISTCATSGDSVKLPSTKIAKKVIYIVNNGAASCDVFPHLGGQINGGGANIATTLLPGELKMFIAISSTLWYTNTVTGKFDTISERTSGNGVIVDGVLIKDGKLLSGETGVLLNAPFINGTLPSDTIVFFEDFITTASTKAAGNGKFAVADNSTEWFVTEVDSATGQTETVIGIPADDAVGGWGTFTTCNADNDALSAQLNGSSFKLATGKKLWFETKFAIEDVSETEFFIGLAPDGTTDAYGVAGAGVSDHVGFMLDGDGNLDCSVDQNSTQIKADTTVDFVDGSIATLETANVVHTCSFYWDGAGVVKFYVDGVLKNTVTDNGTTVVIPDDEILSPVFTILTQGNTSETVWIDYIYVAQER